MRSRDPLSPKSILDRRLLEEALAERGIEIKPVRIDEFYQLLHRQHYPTLQQFVERYNRREKLRLGLGGVQVVGDDSDGDDAATAAAAATLKDQQLRATPFPNPVSSKPTKQNLHLLPKALLTFLADPDNGFVTLTSRVAESRLSKDGTTTKLAVELQDGHVVESVIMRYQSPEGSRATLCVSSQVGCAMGCTFCATGTMGIRGNLTSGEILEQIVHANHILAAEAMDRTTSSTPADDNNNKKEEEEEKNDDNDDKGGSDGSKENVQHEKSAKTKASKKKKRKKRQNDNSNGPNHDLVRNVVFMGMGEPLNNYDNVTAACRGLVDCRRWNLRSGRVTVSTVGVTPKIRKLTQDLPEVALALSLHAPNQAARSAIVPTAKAYPIEGLIDALDEHMMAFSKKERDGTAAAGGKEAGVGGYSEEDRKIASKRKRAMVEYVMLEGETSTFECAHQLGKLCENRRLIVNLIPYNQTDVKDKLRCPPREHIDEFQRIVRSYGSFCYVRKTMGADIAGACGQLVVEKEQQAAALPADIEDIGSKRKMAEAAKKTTKKKRLFKKADCSSLSGSKNGGTQASTSTAQEDVQSQHKPTSEHAEKSSSSSSSSSVSGVDDWIRPLAIATTVAATCFVISTALLVSKRRR